ncbi:uncharacterized protein LOC123219670 [Mangifera indica]|uniref:uncharacterized protein LOC123219670 n=1 Tax=Mangifera indica TaxID=29780 RepID=UPI001CF9C9CC|nr:uncharacterized protein LOC123219670 [Mangifera indica]
MVAKFLSRLDESLLLILDQILNNENLPSSSRAIARVQLVSLASNSTFTIMSETSIRIAHGHGCGRRFSNRKREGDRDEDEDEDWDEDEKIFTIRDEIHILNNENLPSSSRAIARVQLVSLASNSTSTIMSETSVRIAHGHGCVIVVVVAKQVDVECDKGMGFEPLEWYCRPVENGIWAKAVDSAFGAYTNCAVDSLVISFSHLVLFGLCIYRIWFLRRSSIAQRFPLSSNYNNYTLGLLAAYCTAEPLLRLVMGISIFNLDEKTSLSPFEVVSLIIEALAWCSVPIMTGLETEIYVREFRWYMRFGVIYVLIGDAAALNLVLPMMDNYSRFYLRFFYLFIFRICILIRITPCWKMNHSIMLNMMHFLKENIYVLRGMPVYFHVPEMLG